MSEDYLSGKKNCIISDACISIETYKELYPFDEWTSLSCSIKQWPPSQTEESLFHVQRFQELILLKF